MQSRTNQILVSMFAGLLLANVAAPGLLLHNCRQFGTRSTQLCACCVAEQESSGGCCSKKSVDVASLPDSETVIESACCYTSIEAPFSFEGQTGLNSTVTAPAHHDVDCDYPSLVSDGRDAVAFADPQSALRNRHSSDPPSYILTHSFRC